MAPANGLSLLQLQLINLSLSEKAKSTLLGSDDGQYAPDGHSGVKPNSSGSSSDGSCCKLSKYKLENEPALHSP